MGLEQFKGKTDEALIQQMRQGAVQVSDYLMDKYKGTVRALADRYYLIGADKEDLVQEGMIGLFKAVRDYQPDRNSSFYSFAVLCIKREMFTAINKYHSKKNMPLNTYISLSAEEKDPAFDPEQKENLIDRLEDRKGFDPEQAVIDSEFLKDFQEQSREFLSDMEAKVLALLINGKNYREIAEELSMTPKSADNAIQRCKQKIGRLWNMDTNLKARGKKKEDLP